MIFLNRITNLKENDVDQQIFNQIQILKDHLLLKRVTLKKDPTMTPKRMRTEPKHIGEKQQKDI